MSNLFQLGFFTLHSGQRSDFKIDCDALTDEDIEFCAKAINDIFNPIYWIKYIPRGGTRLANALEKYIHCSTGLRLAGKKPDCLIVDDVWTTGASMREKHKEIEKTGDFDLIRGAVIFARGPVDYWVTPLFTTWESRR